MKSHLKIVYAKVSDPETDLDGTLQSINGKIMLLAKNGDIISNCISPAAMNLKPGDSFKTFNLTIKLPSLIPKGHSELPLLEYDIMYTKDKSRKVKRWHDGLLKYKESERLAVFYDEEGKELLKKVMPSSKVREGEMLETAQWFIEITARKINALQGDVTKSLIENIIKRPLHSKNQEITKRPKLLDRSGGKENVENSVEWNIVYTEDKHKKLKKKWLDGKMMYNSATEDARFYDEQEGVIFHRQLTSNQVYEGAELDSGRYQFVLNELSNSLNAANLPKEVKQFIPTKRLNSVSFQVRKEMDKKIANNAKQLKRLNERETLTPKAETIQINEQDEEESDSIIPFTSDASPQKTFAGFTSVKAVLLEEQKESITTNDGEEDDEELMALLGDGKPKSKSLFN